MAQRQQAFRRYILALWAFPAAILSALGTSATAQSTNDQAVLLSPVIVTARQIEEPLREVPFGVTVISRERMETSGIEDTESLYRYVPGFNYTDSGLPEANLLNMRGIGSSSTFLAPSVTYYIDGVPIPQRAFDQRLLDVERIEVLRGPQGTLFGQNSQAGAVNIITAGPGEVAEVESNIEYGSFDSLQLTQTFSGSITDNLAGRISGQYYRRDGDIDNFQFDSTGGIARADSTIREQRTGSLSGKAQAKPNDTTLVTISGRYQNDERKPTTGLLLNDADFPRNALSPQPDNDLTSGGGSMTVEHSFDLAKLTSITGFQAYELSLDADITDGFLASETSGLPPFIFAPENSLRSIDEDLIQWSQELRLDGGTENGTRWVSGLSALFADFKSATDVTSLALANGRYEADIETTNLAAFGEVTVPFGDELRVIGGLRLAHIENDFDGQFTGRDGGAPALANFAESGDTEDTFVTGRAGLSYDLTSDVTAYGTIARGEKAGGFPFFNQSAAFGIAQEPFDSSSTWSYEAGIRGGLLNDRLQLSAALFFNDTKNEQLFNFNPIVGQFEVENADTESYGAELEVEVRPSRGLSLSGSIAVLQTEVVDSEGGSLVSEGNDVPYAPNISFSLSADYFTPAEPFGLSGDVFGGATYQYVGDREIDPANSAALDSYSLLHLRAGWRDDGVEIYAFADNVLDEQYAVSGFRAGVGTDGSTVIGGVPGQPLIAGIGIRLRF